jgi:hypothetical protein
MKSLWDTIRDWFAHTADLHVVKTKRKIPALAKNQTSVAHPVANKKYNL